MSLWLSQLHKPSLINFLYDNDCCIEKVLIIDLLQRGLKAVNVSGGKLGTAETTKCFASDPAQLKSAREDIKELLETNFCHPILVNTFH